MDRLGREVECSICYHTWSNPKTLPCSHVFCQDCLIRLTNQQTEVTCPECRAKHPVPSQGLHNAWPTQRALINLANQVRELAIVDIGRISRPSLKVDPQQSSLEVRGPTKAKVHTVYGIIVKLRGINGECVDLQNAQDQVTAFVELTPLPRNSQKEAVTLRDAVYGECGAMYQANRCGLHKFLVLVGDSPVRNSPVTVEIGPRGFPGCEIKGPLKGPRDVICYGENFLITDGIQKAVFLVDHAGRELKKLKLQSELTDLFAPMAISSHKGKVFVTDMGNSCIHVYNDIDRFPNQIGGPSFPHLKKPTGMVVSPGNGRIFVVDNVYKHVAVLEQRDHATSVIRVIQFPHRKGAGLNNPQMAAMNSRGDLLLIADQDDSGHNCIKVINVTTNKIERQINVRLNQFQTKPYGIAVSKDDVVYVSVRIVPSTAGRARTPRKGPGWREVGRGGGGDQEPERSPHGMVIVYNIMGHFLGVFGNQPYQLDGPGGIMIAEDSGEPSIAYVADSPGRGRNGSLKGFII